MRKVRGWDGQDGVTGASGGIKEEQISIWKGERHFWLLSPPGTFTSPELRRSVCFTAL